MYILDDFSAALRSCKRLLDPDGRWGTSVVYAVCHHPTGTTATVELQIDGLPCSARDLRRHQFAACRTAYLLSQEVIG